MAATPMQTETMTQAGPTQAGPGGAARAVVLLSGGLDSATALAIARSRGLQCHALSISYGQRHASELDAAVRVAAALGAHEHRVMRVDLAGIGGSALTDRRIEVPEQPTDGIPVTYVPARNTIMLSMALAWAEVLGARALVIGVNVLDSSGYPDCRPEFVSSFEQLATLATRAGAQGARFQVLAPLIAMTKAQIIRTGVGFGVDYSLTVSCYQADSDGRACGRCDSCRLRRDGFRAAGVSDPTRYR